MGGGYRRHWIIVKPLSKGREGVSMCRRGEGGSKPGMSVISGLVWTIYNVIKSERHDLNFILKIIIFVH